MSIELALKKVVSGSGADLEHFLSAFPAQLLFRTEIVKGTAGGANGKAEYIGIALPDSLKTQPRWQIKKLIYDANGFNTQVLFANGSAAFDKIFDSGASDYASYTYTTT